MVAPDVKKAKLVGAADGSVLCSLRSRIPAANPSHGKVEKDENLFRQ